MTVRILPILNVIGCLALISLVVVQWRKERMIERDLTLVTHQLDAARGQIGTEALRRSALEHDIATLKEAIEATQKAAEATTREFAETSELVTGLRTELDAARAQVTAWEAAIQARDERIHTLTNDLAATRKRLDEAIARLKTAAKTGG